MLQGGLQKKIGGGPRMSLVSVTSGIFTGKGPPVGTNRVEWPFPLVENISKPCYWYRSAVISRSTVLFSYRGQWVPSKPAMKRCRRQLPRYRRSCAERRPRRMDDRRLLLPQTSSAGSSGVIPGIKEGWFEVAETGEAEVIPWDDTDLEGRKGRARLSKIPPRRFPEDGFPLEKRRRIGTGERRARG